jgi:hypothetical protein
MSGLIIRTDICKPTITVTPDTPTVTKSQDSEVQDYLQESKSLRSSDANYEVVYIQLYHHIQYVPRVVQESLSREQSPTSRLPPRGVESLKF